MAFAVAGQRSAQPISILNTRNVATSFPGFVDLAISCGMQLRQHP
jgi:3-phosphoshikimate 1-carboxyvinyltransferase